MNLVLQSFSSQRPSLGRMNEVFISPNSKRLLTLQQVVCVEKNSFPSSMVLFQEETLSPKKQIFRISDSICLQVLFAD